MSAAYANRLKDYPKKGVCGLPEVPDSTRALTVKINRLVAMIKEAKRIVILTGAGISTSCGIPDFRGPSGIWTEEEKKRKQQRNERRRRQKIGQINNKRQRTSGGTDSNEKNDVNHNTSTTITANELKQSRKYYDDTPSKKEDPPCDSSDKCLVDFSTAKPSLTHRAITYLTMQTNIVQHVITQNIDGLHQRSGLSRNRLDVLHGCAFTEKCPECGTEYFRDYDIGGISFQPTGRQCEICSAELLDTLLDWDDPLPEYDICRATEQCANANLAICLGTSLRIEPAGTLPTLAQKYVIVNLQETAKDEQAALVIRGRVDYVMQCIMEQLELDGWDDAMNTTVNNHNSNSSQPNVERIWKPT